MIYYQIIVQPRYEKHDSQFMTIEKKQWEGVSWAYIQSWETLVFQDYDTALRVYNSLYQLLVNENLI